MMHKGLFFQRFLWIMVVLSLTLLSASSLVRAQDAPKALASDEITSGVRVDILELKRTSGGTLTLKFAIVNDSKNDLNLRDRFTINDGNYWNVGKVTLLDAPNKKKYLVMTDSEKSCVCSKGESSLTHVKAGTRSTFWAKFQAPPETVSKITVEIPGAPPFEDLPISS